MDTLKTLKGQIRDLTKISNVEHDSSALIVEKLQLLGNELITKYVIKVGDVTIEPLWVEAYYSNKNNGFEDPFIHGKEEQSKFGILYFHHNTDDSRSGVDICLSLCNEDKNESKYYLSYLLKYTLVNGEFTTQSQLSAKIRKVYNLLSESDKSRILSNKTFNATNTNDIVGYTTRIGLKATDSDPETEKIKKSYISLKLAIAKNFDKSYSCEKKLPKLESLADNYLSTYDSGNKENWYIDHFGYCPKKYKGK